MWPAILLLITLQTEVQGKLPKGKKAEQAAVEISQSGRCAELAETPDERVAPGPRIAPGPPPVLSFRFYEGKVNHRFGNSELLLDDAGH